MVFFESVELHFFNICWHSLQQRMGYVKCNNDYSVQNDELLHRYSTNEIRVRKRDEKVKRFDLRREQKMERQGSAVTCDGRLFQRRASQRLYKFLLLFLYLYYCCTTGTILHNK